VPQARGSRRRPKVGIREQDIFLPSGRHVVHLRVMLVPLVLFRATRRRSRCRSSSMFADVASVLHLLPCGRALRPCICRCGHEMSALSAGVVHRHDAIAVHRSACIAQSRVELPLPTPAPTSARNASHCPLPTSAVAADHATPCVLASITSGLALDRVDRATLVRAVELSNLDLGPSR